MTSSQPLNPKKLAQQQSYILSITSEMAANQRLPKLLHQIAQAAHTYSHAYITRLTTARLSAHLGPSFPDEKQLNHSLQDWINRNPSPALNPVSRFPAPIPTLGLQGIAYLATLAIQSPNQDLGYLWLAFQNQPDLGEFDLSFLHILAHHAAVALAQYPHDEAQTIVASIRDAVFLLDDHLTLRALNPAAETLFDLPAEDAIGAALETVIQNYDLNRYIRGLTGTLSARFFITHKDHIYQPILSDVRLSDGSQAKLVVLTDVNHFKRVNENMTIFLQTVSHDLRSPLTAAKGFLDMLPMVGELNEKQNTMREKILTSINDMTNLVEKVLDAGRLDPEMGAYELRREPCDPTQIIEKVASTLSGAAQRKQIDLQAAITHPIPVLNLDEMMIERALINLVENAIKYTPENGHIRLIAFIHRDELHLCVQDDGYGISPELQAKIFEKGSRIRRAEHKAVRGSGLGLFIVKNVAQQHGGDALVESVEGEGSTFSIIIPIEGPNIVGQHF